MRCPPAADFVLAHRASRISLFCAVFYLLYLFVQQGDMGVGVLFLLSLALGSYARRASARVAAYRSWKGEWNQMAGGDSAPPRPRLAPWRRAFNAVAGVVAWTIGGIWLLYRAPQADAAALTTIGGSFGVLTLWGAVAVLSPLLRRRRTRQRQQARARPFIVRVVPSLPSHSPTPADIHQRLPPYLTALMAPRSASDA